MPGRVIQGLERRGPFLRFGFIGDAELIVHCMLAGRLQIAEKGVKPVPHLCFSFTFDNGDVLRYGDENRMGGEQPLVVSEKDPKGFWNGEDELAVGRLSRSCSSRYSANNRVRFCEHDRQRRCTCPP